MTDTNYNNGKDLMPGDIKIYEVEVKDPSTGKPSGAKVYQAYLGFVIGGRHFGVPLKQKFYIATGVTPEEARKDLVSLLKEHLDRAIA